MKRFQIEMLFLTFSQILSKLLLNVPVSPISSPRIVTDCTTEKPTSFIYSGISLFTHITVVFFYVACKAGQRTKSSNNFLRSSFTSSAKEKAVRMLTVFSRGRLLGSVRSSGTAGGSEIPSICKSKFSLNQSIW